MKMDVIRRARLVQDSFESVGDMQEALGKLFYGRLFELHPNLRPLFVNDISVKSRKLMATLETAVQAADRMDELRPVLRELGRRHKQYGAEVRQYEVVTSALMWALSQAIGLDPETRQAWSELLAEISREMIAGMNDGE